MDRRAFIQTGFLTFAEMLAPSSTVSTRVTKAIEIAS